MHGRKIAVVGLGYIGLPVAVAFARSGVSVVGFDADVNRTNELANGRDRTRQTRPPDLAMPNLKFARSIADLAAADFFLITVPGSIDSTGHPDISGIINASDDIGGVLKSGDIVVYESTVYPGATESACIPALERRSGLKAGRDFGVGYSPERLNPGDQVHNFASIAKVIAAHDPNTLDTLAEVYGSVVTAGVYRAPSIKVAEAAKAFENIQRDVNIALVNELSAISRAVGIDTADVLAAAGTKWNFLPFTPGLVGGRCMTSDAYYLADAAQRAGVLPELIQLSRHTNDSVVDRVARECVGILNTLAGPPYRIVVLGMTFKENVPDIRSSGAIEIVRNLQSRGAIVQVHDPIANPEEVKERGIDLVDLGQLTPADAVLLAVPHAEYVSQGWHLIRPLLNKDTGLVMDLKAKLDRSVIPPGVQLWRL